MCRELLVEAVVGVDDEADVAELVPRLAHHLVDVSAAGTLALDSGHLYPLCRVEVAENRSQLVSIRGQCKYLGQNN